MVNDLEISAIRPFSLYCYIIRLPMQLSFRPRQAKYCLRTCANAQIQIILRMSKVSSEHLLSIETSFNIQ